MPRTSVATMLAIVLCAASAWAHPQRSIDLTTPQPTPAGLQGGLYVWSCVGETSIWQEANGEPTNGMFADPAGSKILGLQLHNVCLGTFTPSICDPANGPCDIGVIGCANRAALVGSADCLNCHHGNFLFSYLPWGYFGADGKFVDGTEADCLAAGGTRFVPKDRFVYGQYDDLTYHSGTPATECFPPGYGRAP